MSQETRPHSTTDPDTHLPPSDSLEGLGEFALQRRLGQGAYGEVWLARDLSPLGRLVALKFLRLTADAGRRQQALAVLQNEARLLAVLRHPNIVAVHAWREVPGWPAAQSRTPALVLQYVAGGSLADVVAARGPLPWHLAGRYVADIADGLLLVHRRGVIHRDVKPANLLLDCETDEALLTDFGIAARLADPRAVAGTPLYMAPEAFAGDVSPALDVYSLAASLFWLITGAPPFDGADRHELLARVERGLPARDPRLAVLPAPLEELVRAGLAPRPQARPGLTDFARRLRGALNLLLADQLRPHSTAPVHLRLIVSRRVENGSWVPVAGAQHSDDVPRDLCRVPGRPDRVTLRTGDRVRLEVEAQQPGHVTVFNVGPTGNLNLLYPADPSAAAPLLPGGCCLHIMDVELTPPAGQERLFALWTRRPLPLPLEELRSLVEQGTLPASGAYRATRDMARVGQSMNALSPEDRHVVVLELDHQ
jgi:serine/threonine protein kinase